MRGADGVGDHQCRLRDLVEGRREQHLHHVHRQELAILGGQHQGLGERVLARVGEALRTRHHLEGVERAAGRRGEVEVLAVLCQLGQLGEPGERSGGVEHDGGDAAPYRLVGDLAEQHALAGAQASDDRDEARGLLLLGRVVGVEHDGAAGRAGGVADVRTAAVAQLARGGGNSGGHVERGQPAAVRRGGDRLAGDELAQQAVLPSRVLDGDPAAPVGGDDLAHPLEALVLGASRNREAEPAMDPGGGHLDAAAHLVLDLAGVAGLAVQGERLVEVVLAVVPLHVADHEELALDRLAGVGAGQYVELGGPLDGEGEPVGVGQPRLVAGVGCLDLLQPADRHHRDVPGDRLLRPAGHRDGAAKRLHGVVDLVGERVEIVGVPHAVVSAGRQLGRRGEAEPDRSAQQPLHLLRGGGPAVETRRGRRSR